MYDICIGRPKSAATNILLTVTDKGAAERIEAVLKAEKEHIHQLDGKPHIRTRKMPGMKAPPKVEVVPVVEPNPIVGTIEEAAGDFGILPDVLSDEQTYPDSMNE